MTTQDEIAKRAREIWEREGRPEGRDVEHWLQAEKELRQTTAQPQAAAGGPAGAGALLNAPTPIAALPNSNEDASRKRSPRRKISGAAASR